MKDKKNTIEISVGVIFLIAVLMFADPFSSFMPSQLEMMSLLIFIIVAALFLTLIWREKVRDERDGYHRLFVGRVGYISGIAILAIGIAFQAYEHAIDPWLVYALAAMTIAKVVGMLVAERYY